MEKTIDFCVLYTTKMPSPTHPPTNTWRFGCSLYGNAKRYEGSWGVSAPTQFTTQYCTIPRIYNNDTIHCENVLIFTRVINHAHILQLIFSILLHRKIMQFLSWVFHPRVRDYYYYYYYCYHHHHKSSF